MMKSRIKSSPEAAGHRQRLRDRFLAGGLAGFHDYEIVELLLTLNTPRKDCKPSAKALMRRFKSLPGVFEATREELQKVKGVGPANSLGLKLIKAVADRYLEYRMLDRDILKNSGDLKVYLHQTIGHKTRELFLGIFLDAKNGVMATEVLFEGSLTTSAVYPREVIAKALEHRAAAIIFAHNHPSGDPSPSPEDISLTKRLVFACRTMGITVHEHLITASDSCYSFADQGLIKAFNREFETSE